MPSAVREISTYVHILGVESTAFGEPENTTEISTILESIALQRALVKES